MGSKIAGQPAPSPGRWLLARRRLFTLISALSLLLCLATTALWARSHRLGDYGEFIGSLESRNRENLAMVRCSGFFSTNGRLGVGFFQHNYLHDTPHLRRYAEGRRLVWGKEYCWQTSPFMPISGFPASPASGSWYGIGMCDQSWSGYQFTMTSSGVAVPHWLIVSLTAALPLLWLRPHCIRYHRRRRANRLLAQNLCPDCGYDLRATPSQCPECGGPGIYA